MCKPPPKKLLDPLNTQATTFLTFYSTINSHSIGISSDHMSWDTDSSELYIDTCVTRGIASHKFDFISGTFQNYEPKLYDGSGGLLIKIG